MDKVNQEFAGQLLFEDHETGKELSPSRDPQNEDGNIVLCVTNRDGSRNWKHTIKTEEI